MFGLNTKSLVIGLVVGYLVLPRITAPITAAVSGVFTKADAS